MNIQEVKRTLCGPMIPVITNLKEDLSVDLEAIKFNINSVVERGFVKGSGVLLAVGAGGDFPMLTLQERKDVAKAIVDAADGRTPVLVGAQDNNPQVSIEMAQFAEEIGAYGIQLAPPFYYEPSDDDVLRWFRLIHGSTKRIAIMAYNTWWHGYNMSPDMVARLAELERVVSLKWSTPNGGADYAKGVARFADQLAVVDNQGLQVLTHMLGGTGYITHLATVWPEHDLSLWGKMEAGDYAGALSGFQNVNWPWTDFRGKMWARTGGESSTVKAALEICGRPGGAARYPTRVLTDEERAELREILTRIGAPNIQA
ncbi:dihydrodipicolinate synthase family protein [bacterium]|nr:dihydrodipicolinate synthase family protein [bacterium]